MNADKQQGLQQNPMVIILGFRVRQLGLGKSLNSDNFLGRGRQGKDGVTASEGWESVSRSPR